MTRQNLPVSSSSVASSPLRPGVVEQRIALPTGVELAYVAQGPDDGVPLVLLHGLSDSWHSWEPMLPCLPLTVRANAISLRGHGDSDKPAIGYAPADIAADIAAFMDALAIESAVVVGHSMGSVIAQRFAIDYPERVAGLVLEGAIGALAAIPDSEAFAAMIASLTDPLDPVIVREFQLSTITQPVAPEHVDRFVQESLKVPAHVWHSVIAALMGDDTYQRISAIRAPTVLLWGDQDGVGTRDAQEALVAGIANARLIVYAGTGHAVHWEQPERAAADISAFIDSLASTSHGGATA